jgi:hypothetical protein
MNRGELSKALAKGKAALQAKGVQHLALFGSYARGGRLGRKDVSGIKTTYMLTYGLFAKQNQFQPFIHAVRITLSPGHFNLIILLGKPPRQQVRAPLRRR